MKPAFSHQQIFAQLVRFSCLLASPYLWCRRHFYGSQFLHWGSPSSSHPRERTVPQADINKVWLTLVTYWSNNAHFQYNVIFPWPQIFLSRIPVSNVHVVLGCYGNSSFTSTCNLKALEKFTLTASCRKVSFILHHPDEDGMSQEGRLAHIRKDAEVEREKCEHNSGWTKATRSTKTLWWNIAQSSHSNLVQGRIFSRIFGRSKGRMCRGGWKRGESRRRWGRIGSRLFKEKMGHFSRRFTLESVWKIGMFLKRRKTQERWRWSLISTMLKLLAMVRGKVI